MTTVLKLFRWLLYLLLGLALVLALYLFGMRFADGPSAIVAGGAFTTGEPHRGPEPDWAFVKDRQEVEFQLLEPPRSRTTWIMEHDGRIYIPCGYMDTTWGRIWKQWPIEAEANGQAILRIEGTLYDRALVRVKSGPEIPHLLSELARKYFPTSAAQRQQAIADAVQQVNDESLWIFELRPRG